MVKLIRLTSEKVDGTFNTSFNQGIPIKKNSKIALQNLSFEQLDRTIEIDADNDEISVEYKKSTTTKVKLTHNIYNPNNIDFLFNDMTRVLNSSLNNKERNQQNIEWKVQKNKNNKVEIFFKKNKPVKILNKSVSENILVVSNKYERVGGVVGTLDSYVSSEIYMSRGSGYLRCKTSSIDGDLIMGLSTIQPDSTVYPTLDTINYGIYLNKGDDTYNLINNGVKSPVGSTATVNVNTWMEVDLSLGLITVNIYNSSSPYVETLDVFSYDGSTKLYPYIFILGSNSTKVQIRYTESPLDHVSLDKYEVEDTTGLSVKPPNFNNTQSFKSITFESVELSEFLGFNSPSLTPIKGYTLYYEAENLFLLNNYNDSFIVELFNVNLSSYDSAIGGRKNILAVVPSSEINETGIVYEASNLVFINIGNYNDEILTNLRLKVYQRDYSTINMKGLAVMTLLIKDNDE